MSDAADQRPKDSSRRILPNMPRDSDGPVFAAPWQAQAFAMTVRLYEQGCFTWAEWAGTLASEIKAAQAVGDPDLGDTYYDHWLRALERICADKGLIAVGEREARRAAWERAALRTPHGQPIALEDGATEPGKKEE